MQYKPFNDIELSLLGMGNMRLPMQADKPGTPIDRERAQEIIDYAIENGINYFDTAYVYHNGESEEFLGEALSKYPRESYYLATKFLLWASKDYKSVFKEQLSRLKTDFIDFYLIHSISDDNFQQYIDCGCIEYFLEQQKKGRIKFLGFSSHASVESITVFADHHQWDFAQIQLNYFDWAYGSAKQEYEVLEKRRIPVMVMEPVRGGRLASLSLKAEAMLKAARPDWSLASWALRWVKKLSGIQIVLSGMSTTEQIKENVELFSNNDTLSDEEEKLLFKACEAFREEVIVPCTACRYCCDGCPAHIEIHKILEVYNRYKTDGPWALKDMSGVNSKGKPEDCIECGVCSSHCPQNIDIKGIMHELATR